jgi:hypothetical protein
MFVEVAQLLFGQQYPHAFAGADSTASFGPFR